ncbi:GNAT family N-acetyltransferase [Comamonas serinivorans]|uniref:GNAT family N-acetyltransferase n=1 Tax=Comamonas serinivorans TaxID=1082851 RepID=A0A1Y0ENZ6_9BURK|nr:GNAT family N-acetyltransferase [Comamonas serinivorans]ARU05178.1 GNAT family N-acetyltransferase [Comamonas serinivorans]
MNRTTLTFRPATPDDASLCIRIRGLTRENAFSAADLRALGITAESWSRGIQDGSCPGFVACMEGQMIGYCFGDRDTGEIVVLALLPAYEGQGIGKALLAMMVESLGRRGFQRLFLACSSDPNVRSYSFYRHLGWRPTGEKDASGDDILELSVHQAG